MAASAAGAGIAGILLAAGYARRFGADKLMHPLSDGTPVALASALALRAALPRMLAVVRPDNPQLLQLFASHGVEIIVAPRAVEGMGASLAQGIAAAADADGWLIALADMPNIQSATIVRVAAAIRAGAAIAAPYYQGRRGHPVGFAAKFGPALRALSGDEGARTLLAQHGAEIVRLDCDDPGVLADIDVPGDLGCTPN